MTALSLDAPVDLSARRRRAEDAIARVAAEPVRFVPAAFLAALECLEAYDDDAPAGGAVVRLAR